MEEQIKLVWDFKGPDAEHFATHHEIHLKEYAEANGVDSKCGSEPVAEMHWMAFMIVQRSIMIQVRDALKPHRGLKV